MANEKHPDTLAIDRVGEAAIYAHFGITRQALHYWRTKGVPDVHRKTLAMLGAVAGQPMPEMSSKRGKP